MRPGDHHKIAFAFLEGLADVLTRIELGVLAVIFFKGLQKQVPYFGWAERLLISSLAGAVLFQYFLVIEVELFG